MGESKDFFGEPLSLAKSFIKMSSELSMLRDELKKQDNQMTAHPIYTVQEVRKKGNDEDEDVLRFVQAFFTKKAAKEFIELEKYHFGKLIIYVTCGQYNPEWCMIREFLHGNKEDQ